MLRGAAAGTVATGVMSTFMWLARRAGLLGQWPPRKITDRLVAAVIGQRPERPYRQALAAAAHLSFGATAGALFALGGSRLVHRSHRVLAGAAWGTAVWATMYGYALPAAKLMPKPEHDRLFRPITMVVAHLIYGSVLGTLG